MTTLPSFHDVKDGCLFLHRGEFHWVCHDSFKEFCVISKMIGRSFGALGGSLSFLRLASSSRCLSTTFLAKDILIFPGRIIHFSADLRRFASSLAK